MLEPVINQIIMWLSMIILIAFSAFFSSSETAFSSVNRIRIKKLAADGNKHAKRVLKLNDEYTRVLTGVLIGNNIVNIAASTISTLLFTMYFGAMGAGISTVVLTIAILIFGEVIPKTIARDKAELVCMKSSGVICFFTIIFTPVIFVFDKIKNLIDKTDENDKKPTMTEQELKFVIDEIEYQGILEDHEGELVRSALDLDETTAEKAMTPRVDLISIEVDSDIEYVRDIFLNEKYSRLPVYKKDIDNVIGILSEKDFLRAYLSGDKFTISDLVKKAPLVPPQMNISDLMVKFQKGKPHMAIVVDQYGGVEGIITLEDVLEQLVGNIYDEKDSKQSDIKKIDESSWWVNPDIGVDEMYEAIDLNDYDADDESNTVGGWVLKNLEKVPDKDDKFLVDGLEVTVSEMDDKRIVGIIVKKMDKEKNFNA